jgi:hypothetical protein
MNTRELVKSAVEHYLKSNDFNGLLLKDMSPSQIRRVLKPLLEKEILAVRYGDVDLNPFIRPFSDPPIDLQLRFLRESKLDLVVVYPTKKELVKHINPNDYNGRPFTLELAKGCGQLDYRAFDLTVLEFYRNDARYYYRASDVSGAIYAEDDSQHSLAESDRIFLKTFGFG